MVQQQWIEVAGYIASALVFLSFYMQTMIPLRVIAILSNVAFIVYGFGEHLYPVLILHGLLLPLNWFRLMQMLALIRKVRQASNAGLSMEWLLPLMRRRHCAKGDVLFRKGDPAKELYVVLSGSLRLIDVSATVGTGSVLGEIGIFAPMNNRMDTAICETDVELGVISHDKVLELYHQNRKFGLYLIELVVQRLLENYETVRGLRQAS
jgi:CRP/FNR family transcriptional regulator, cyclic AMP receptor protein